MLSATPLPQPLLWGIKMKKSRHFIHPCPAQQDDKYLITANPVSGTKYTVLDTTKNVRIIAISADITWATTQPTPLEVWVTIDGIEFRYVVADPISETVYFAICAEDSAPTGQTLSSTSRAPYRTFLLEGRSVKVEVEITWETTQPTPLNCRVKYAKW